MSWLTKVIRKPSFWFILILLELITLPHYEGALEHPAFLSHLTASLGLTRHALERILFLATIVWAGFLFGLKGAVVTSLAALACMLPRAIYISASPADALFETGAIFIVGNVLAISFDSLRKEREHRTQLEMTQRELQASEQRYRELFENAHDAVWLHDLQENIIAAIPQGGADTVLEVVLIYDDSQDVHIELRYLIWGTGVGWYRQHTLKLDRTAAQTLFQTLGYVRSCLTKLSPDGSAKKVIPLSNVDRTQVISQQQTLQH